MLRRHLESKHSIKPKKGTGAHCVGCMDCGKTFTSKGHLWKHRKSVHSQASTGNQDQSTSKPKDEPHDTNKVLSTTHTSASPPRAKRLVAPKTLKASSETVSISGKRHGMNIAKRHLGFYCICGIKFISRKSLDGHVRFQNKNPQSSSLPISKIDDIGHKVVSKNPLQCICGFRSANKYSTKKHVTYYTTERKFQCDLCSKRVLNMAFLRDHYVKSHKLSKDLALGTGCSKCGLSFETMKEYYEHHRTIHGVGSATKGVVKEENELAEVIAPSPSLTSSKFRSTGLPANRPRRGMRLKDVRESFKEQDDDEDYFGSPNSPQPIPIPIYFEDDDDEEMPTLSKVEPNRAQLPVKQEVEEDSEDPSPLDILEEVHEHDTTRRSKFFYCTCGNKFGTRKVLRVHIKQKTEKWNFSCEICNKLFFYNSTLKAHMLKSYGGGSEDSQQAEKTEKVEKRDEAMEKSTTKKTTPPPSVPTPIKRKGQSPKLTTPEGQEPHEFDTEKLELGLFYCTCGTNCKSKKSLAVHISYYKKERKFYCTMCPSRFPFQSFLTQHLERTHKIDRGGLGEASVTHRVRQQVQCTKCGQDFKTQVELLRHNKLFHKTTSLRQAAKSRIRKKKLINGDSAHHQVSSGSSDIYTCACGLSYALKGSLSKHILKKSRGKIFKCSQCPKTFWDSSHLRLHTKAKHNINLEDKRHGCGICGKLFGSAEECKTHRIWDHGAQR